MYTVIWHYQVRPGQESAFEAMYGPDGDWATLFREHPGYLGTELLRELDGSHYLTLDRWMGQAEYEQFLESAPSRYAALDARGDALTLDERRLGRYLPR